MGTVVAAGVGGAAIGALAAHALSDSDDGKCSTISMHGLPLTVGTRHARCRPRCIQLRRSAARSSSSSGSHAT